MQVSIFYHFQKLEVKEKKLLEKNHEEKSGFLVQLISKQYSVLLSEFQHSRANPQNQKNQIRKSH